MLRKFAAEGGRIIFMGDHEDAYPGISIENQFLADMGAELYNTGGAVDCILDNPAGTRFPALPGKDKRHPIMEGVRELSMACASVIEPGAGDFPLFFDTTGTFVLGGVAKIETTPVTKTKAAAVQNKRPALREKLVNPGSLTGK